MVHSFLDLKKTIASSFAKSNRRITVRSCPKLFWNLITGMHGGLLPVTYLAFEMLAFLSSLMVGRKKSTMPQVHILPAFVQVYTFGVI